MSDNEPIHPRGASLGGRAVVILGWLIVVLGPALVVAQVVIDTFSVSGVVLAVLVTVAGIVLIAVGQAVERSRER
jgi:hypothetical protein